MLKKEQFKFYLTRDKKIRVLQDKISKVIFLEKDINSTNINNLSPNYTNILKIIRKKKFLDDDKKKFNFFKTYIKNKHILDYGCGFGGFFGSN